MNFVAAVKTCFQKYSNISDRASTEEFGYWMLFMVLTYAVFFAVTMILPMASTFGLLFLAATLVPTLAVSARRRLDVKRSAYWRARLQIHIFPGSIPQYA